MHGGRALLVLATPGSGKTYTMTQRIIRLIEQDNVPPEKILVITFTKAAAGSMQQRFLKESESSEKKLPVNFGTFHSLSYHILKESGDLKYCKILTETEKKNLIYPIIKEFVSQKEELKARLDCIMDDTNTILSAISYYKNTEDMKKTVSQLPQEWREQFALVFHSYEKERRCHRVMDYDDMLYECYILLRENPYVRERWQERFQHILIDETQDINFVQLKIVSLLAQKCNVFAVGDDDQSIYGFRGANPVCLRLFLEDFKAKQLFLGVNYRSRKEIIRASNLVIKENKNRFEKEHFACSEKEAEYYNPTEVVKIHGFEERKQQYEYLISRLHSIEPGKSVAVLFRTNSYMQGLAVRLNREGIAYTMKEKGRSIYDHFIAKDIMAYFKVASGKENRSDFLQIMNKPCRNIAREAVSDGTWDAVIAPKTVSKTVTKGSQGDVGETIGGDRVRNTAQDGKNRREAEESKLYGKIIDYYSRNGRDDAARRMEIRKWQKQMEHLGKMSLSLGIKYIRKVLGYEMYLREKAGKDIWKLEEWEEILNWLEEDALPYKNLRDWSEAQVKYVQTTGQPSENTTLNLMTVHAAKGLEFDLVYIPDCNEKVFPYGSMVEEKACEEERRIFYVAMTRAKENLELLYLTGTKERPRLPSRFLNPLWKDYSSTNSSNSQLSRYSSNASATFSYSSSSAIYSNSGSSLGSSGFSE